MAVTRVSLEEQRAIARLKAGDIRGLETLVRSHQLAALRAVDLIVRDRAAAEDIVQAAFLRAYERISQFDAGRLFGPWFLRSVIHDALKHVARRQRELGLDGELLDESGMAGSCASSALTDPCDLLEAAETAEDVWQALGRLSPQQRAAIVARYYLNLSEREMAQTLECAPGTVKWRLHAAREHLRLLLHASWLPDRAARAVNEPQRPERGPLVRGAAQGKSGR